MKLILTPEAGPLAGREFLLEQGTLALGRGADCGIHFDETGGQVSRRHAVVETLADGFWITDQQSTNGTHVNGRRITGGWLADGDLIELGVGGPRLRVQVAATPPSTRATPMPTAATPTRSLRAAARVEEASLYNPAKDKGKRQSVLAIGVLLVMALAGLGLGSLLVIMTTFQIGPAAGLAGILVAFLPAPFYLAVWLWLDRYDPEPAWALAGCLLWGGGAATFVAAILNDVFGAVVKAVTNSGPMAELLSASISAPFVEEAGKAIAVMVIFFVLRREFDGVLDGIVYAGVVALGFATVENVLYYGRIAAKNGPGGVMALFVLRGVLGPFCHSLFTSMTGIGFGIARQTHNTLLRFAAPVIGYLAAVFLHSLWNTLAGLVPIGLFFLLYLLVWAPLFLVFFGVVVWLGFREARLIQRMLEPEVAIGLVTADQVTIVGSWLRRIQWVLGSVSNPTQLRARRRFLYAASRLGLCYWHVERANAAGGLTQSYGQVGVFRKELQQLKGAV